MRKLYIYCSIIAILAWMSACKSTDVCPESASTGNVGSVLNSGDDDYLPLVYGNKIFFTSVRTEKKKKAEERTYISSIRNDGMFEAAILDTNLPLKHIANSGSPAFYYDTLQGVTELYFAALAGEPGKYHRDIYVAYHNGKSWSEPKGMKFNISTPLYESHPAISPDGKLLVFSSDRPTSIGETDLFVSVRQPNGSWSNPQSLGEEINSIEREISPFIAADGSLLYASKGFRKGTGFDIIKAEYLGDAKWGNPKLLPYPINSTADDNGPTIYKRKILLSSNRGGGCGGFDIYAFDMCGPALISGKVIGDEDAKRLRSTVQLFDADEALINSANLSTGDDYQFEVVPNQSYTIIYSNNCNDKVVSHKFSVPCSDTSVVNIVADFNTDYGQDKYNFEKYDIPFFVSGYYQPNTLDNLESLRLKFDYNIFGTADSTKYIENPGKEYSNYTDEVEKSLAGVVEFIKQKLRYMSGECATGAETIRIQIKGFADPRPISPRAKYADSPINDTEMDFAVQRGAIMDNNLLSKLRAYYTAKYFQRVMEFEESYLDNLDKIRWEISGEGEDNSDTTDNKEKRRVSINVILEKSE